MARSNKALLSELDANTLRCRTLSHAWEEIPVTFIRHRKAVGGIRLTFRCVRCHTLRHEAWSKSGRLELRKYEHPKNWVRIGVMPKDNLRAYYLTQRDGPITTQRRNKRAS